MEYFNSTKRPGSTPASSSNFHESFAVKKARNDVRETSSEPYFESEIYDQDYTCQESKQLKYFDGCSNQDISGDTSSLPENHGKTETVYPSPLKGDTTDLPDAELSTGQGNDEEQDKKEYTSFSEILRELGQESKMVMLQYSQTFGDSEAFEQQACQNCVDLKAHASLLEQDINEKKKLLHLRLKEILKVLSFFSDNDN